MPPGNYSFVVEEHASEAAFGWLLRDAAVRQPHFALRHLAALDQQLEAQLDGLRLAGEAGWEICRDALTAGEPGEVFAASVLALEAGHRELIAVVLETVAAAPELARPLVSALGWLPLDRSRAHIDRLLRESLPGWRRAGLAGATLHRSDAGPAVGLAITSDDALLQARALRSVGELGRLDLLPLTDRYLTSEDPELRFSAGWSAAVLSGKPEALSALAAITESKCRHREQALLTAMRRAEPSAARSWQRRLGAQADTLRLAVQGTGAIGDPVEIPGLIDHMEVPELARLAGESFMMITGADIAYQDLEGERPKDFESGPTENPDDVDVAMDPDEFLPWPDPGLVRTWWQANRHSFHPGTRYLVGKPVSSDWCKQVLRTGFQRQRAAAALELAMLRPGTPLFEVRAPGPRQQRLLGL